MKCSCGHLNPIGIQLCESCGKPQDGMDTKRILQEMRYEGRVRISQSSSKIVFYRMWKFFSSVKVAIYLIAITLILAGIGTLLPQEEYIPSASPQTYYYEHYGMWGDIYYLTGLSTMYTSWWFIFLLGMIGTSLIVCSLDRVVPLYRALSCQQVTKDVVFLENQRVAFCIKDTGDVFPEVIQKMKKYSYVVREEKDSIFAEKGRFSRWGPYVNHVGLIVFLLGLLCSYIPGWYLNESVWVQEGELSKVPYTPYFVKNEKSFLEFHPDSKIIKNYQTNAVLYKKDDQGKLILLQKKNIQVNHPLTYENLNLYQSDMKVDEVHAITFNIVNKGNHLGQFMVELNHVFPNKMFFLNQGMRVRILEYYPDFHFDKKKQQPTTRSNEPHRPAFVFEITKKGSPPEYSWVISGEKFNVLNPNNRYSIQLADLHVANRTGLLVRVDKRLPILFWAGMITMVGLVMGFYWQHRRIWIRRKEGFIYIGAYTNKNWFGLQTELGKIIPSEWHKHKQ